MFPGRRRRSGCTGRVFRRSFASWVSGGRDANHWKRNKNYHRGRPDPVGVNADRGAHREEKCSKESENECREKRGGSRWIHFGGGREHAIWAGQGARGRRRNLDAGAAARTAPARGETTE